MGGENGEKMGGEKGEENISRMYYVRKESIFDKRE